MKGERMTLKEVAEMTGAAYSTVAKYAQRAGWTVNGKQTELNEAQVTAILEAMKQAGNNQHDLPSGLEGIETELSLDFRLAMLYKEAAALEKQRALALEKSLEYERKTHNETKDLLAQREVGLEHIQRICERGGLMTNDREDIAGLYRRGW